MSTHTLTRDQILSIAEKYGEFMFGDAQGDKRLAFAADVIATRERIRDAAQDLLQSCKMALEALEALQGGCTDSDDGTVEALTVWCPEVIESLAAAIAKATGEQQP